VVRVRSADEKRPSPNSSFEKTIWIDRNQLTVVRIVEHVHGIRFSGGGAAGDPMEEDVVTTFSKTILDGPVTETLFHFVPPPDAKLIEDFPNPLTSTGANLVGEQAPPLKLKSAAGRIQTLDSFRGKPVLIDLWATWCGPCVDALPKLNQLYHEAAKNGLVVISVDRDEEAKTATDFLAKKGYAWPNFHDDGETEKLVGSSGIPRTLLIDAQGKVIYDAAGMNEGDLRTQIAKLGPEYAFLAPKKDKNTPCPASE
jgi:thiol-disulfide isomerase/thioredoxin